MPNEVKAPTIQVAADHLADGEKLAIAGENTLFSKQTITFTAKIVGELADNATITFGHGCNVMNGTEIVITPTRLIVRNYDSNSNCSLTEFEHGLIVKQFITGVVDADAGDATAQIVTADELYTTESFCWTGRRGEIFVRSDGVLLKDVSLRFDLRSLSEKIWIFGDSYLNFANNARWPYHAKRAGYTGYAMFGFPGMGAVAALDALKQSLEYTISLPQYAVWLMGMNNGDGLLTNTLSSKWLAATEEFLDICEKKKITPILSTIPSTPTVYNERKNEWVRKSAYRYVDMASAVEESYDASLIGTETGKPDGNGGFILNTTGYTWHDGMLSYDEVHPTALGAVAFYEQLIKDFPEIVQK